VVSIGRQDPTAIPQVLSAAGSCVMLMS
jgi:hypothetical protein